MSTTPRRPPPRSWREFVVEVNDGIISTAGIVEGLVAADVRTHTVLISAAVALVVGSVTTGAAQFTESAYLRDAAMQAVEEERRQIALSPDAERAELAAIYVDKGLSEDLAEQVAAELMAVDPLGAHIEEELDVDEDDFRPPLIAAGLSALAYAAGAVLPILISLMVPAHSRLLTTGIAVVIALVITSYVGATIGHTSPVRTVVRTVGIGIATLVLAAGVGQLLD